MNIPAQENSHSKKDRRRPGRKVLFFPFYRLETKPQNGFKLNPKYNDFNGLWLDSFILSTLFPNVTSVSARLYTVQCKGVWQEGGIMQAALWNV